MEIRAGAPLPCKRQDADVDEAVVGVYDVQAYVDVCGVVVLVIEDERALATRRITHSPHHAARAAQSDRSASRPP